MEQTQSFGWTIERRGFCAKRKQKFHLFGSPSLSLSLTNWHWQTRTTAYVDSCHKTGAQLATGRLSGVISAALRWR